MDTLISIAEAARILDVSIPTVTYYIKQQRLRFEYSDKRTAGRKRKRVVYREDVEALKASLPPVEDDSAKG